MLRQFKFEDWPPERKKGGGRGPSSQSRGSAWSKDMSMKSAKTDFTEATPGPGSYKFGMSLSETAGSAHERSAWAKDKTAKHTIPVEQVALRKTPGPGSYDKDKSLADSTTGGRFRKTTLPSMTELMVGDRLKNPGPGRYRLPDFADSVPLGGKFSLAQVPGLPRASPTPGPGAHHAATTFGADVEFGFFSQVRRTSVGEDTPLVTPRCEVSNPPRPRTKTPGRRRKMLA